MTWQPIETAPKDGTAILLCDEESGKWDNQQWSSCVVGWWDTDDEPEWRDNGDMGCNGQCEYEPTHWMPLPEPPKPDTPTGEGDRGGCC